jgi:hypothetical protein
MKKAAFIFLLASFSSLVAAAGNDVLVEPGDPKKEQQKQPPTFTLAQGYFSIFNIFSMPLPEPDTSRVAIPPVITQPPATKKS